MAKSHQPPYPHAVRRRIQQAVGGCGRLRHNEAETARELLERQYRAESVVAEDAIQRDDHASVEKLWRLGRPWSMRGLQAFLFRLTPTSRNARIPWCISGNAIRWIDSPHITAPPKALAKRTHARIATASPARTAAIRTSANFFLSWFPLRPSVNSAWPSLHNQTCCVSRTPSLSNCFASASDLASA